jgi:hypothetical protein
VCATLRGTLFQPLVIYGMNALFIFALSGFVVKMLYFFKVTQPDGSRLSLRGWLYQPFQALPLAPSRLRCCGRWPSTR